MVFITGSPSVPFNGYETFKLRVSKRDGALNALPVVATCYNKIMIPEYKTKEIMK